MAYIECANGHVYDNGQYTVCPYCNGGGNRIEFCGNTDSSSVGKTVPSGIPSTPNTELGATVAPQSYKASKGTEMDTGKTVGVMQKSLKMEPVVGWFVCIEGPEKGKDYRILAKNNTIGRSEKMDICIKSDTTISRENHARLGFDEKHNVFHIIPAESTNNIYLKDEPIYVPTKLEAYDVLELGETKLLFVPLCTEKFNWKDGLK